MRTTLVATCSLALTLYGATLAGPAAAATGVLTGTWTSTDTDGSSQTLDIVGSGGGGTYAMKLFDDAGTVCDGGPVQFNGRGSFDGTDLLMTGALACLPGGNVLRGAISINFTYDEETDTLTDFSGVVWTRA